MKSQKFKRTYKSNKSNIEIEEINKVFDDQIKILKKYEIHKNLFNLTLDFTIDDWRIIRTEKYWKKIDELLEDDKKIYTLECVEYYIKHLR